MNYLIYFNGEKVKTDNDPLKIKTFVEKYRKRGKVEITALTETGLPKASRMHYNEFFENYGSYKYNPFVFNEI